MYTLQDISGLLLAVLACGLVLVLPGIAIGRLTGALGFRRLEPREALLVAPVLGTALLPALDNVVYSLAGRDATLLVNLSLAGFGLRALAAMGRPWPTRLALGAGLAWLALLTVAWVDFDWNGGLYQSLLMMDTVKHAATARALVESGVAPPPDPFFLRDDPAGYYYFYYLVSALAERLAMGLFDSRAAVGGQIFWTGIALFALSRRLLIDSGIGPRAAGGGLLLIVLAAGGLQVLVIAAKGWVTGEWLAQVNWWNDQVTSFPMALVWVPHHVAALVAFWTGLLLLVPLTVRVSAPATAALPAVLAGLAFASTAGLSVWVTAVGVLAVAFWIGALMLERRFAAVLVIAAAGALAAITDARFLHDLLANRAYAGAPVGLSVRPFPFTDLLAAPGPMREALRLAMLPLNYLIELGLLLVGTVMYWTGRPAPPRGQEARELSRLVLLSAAAGLLIATFVRSTVANNDLGWRAAMFAQLAASLWSAAVLARWIGGERFELSRLLVTAPRRLVVPLGIGLVSVTYDLVGLRAFLPLGLSGEPAVMRDPVVDRELRTANTWLAGHVRSGTVVQHNPDENRSFGFGLYGRAPVAVSDHHNGPLFGARKGEVEHRIAELGPVFGGAVPREEAVRRLGAYRVGAAVVTSKDAAWRERGGWAWTLPSALSLPNVRVVDLGGMKP